MTRPDHPIRVGILGFGFMGRTHALAYHKARVDGYPCQLIAIADPSSDFEAIINDPENQHLLEVACCADAGAVIRDPSIDLVSICTHTDSHVDLTIQALEAGKHVLVEKPVSLSIESIERLARVSEQTDRVCMPAMCMRYWPAWVKIRDMIRSNQYGPVRSADFHRLGSRPAWASDFYADLARSGGVLYDLHIHDTDFIINCFGPPNAVTTLGDDFHLSTLYHYDSPIHVHAQGAWDLQPSAGFRMKCTIACRDATIDFDLSRDEPLVVHQGEETHRIEVGQLEGYDGQVRALLDDISGNPSLPLTTIEDALQTAHLLHREAESRETGKTIIL